MPIEPNAVIARAPEAVFRELSAGEGAVILNLDSGQYHGVNEIGVRIWQVLEAAPTFAELVDGVRSSVADPPAALPSDIASFVTALSARGLVTIRPAGGPAAA